MSAPDRRYLPNSRECFICGEDNASGLRGRFYVEDDAVCMALSVRGEHCGYPGTVHGGVIAAALDECMGWAAARAIGRMCLTGELTVRYLKRVPVDGSLVVRAEILRAHRRMVHTTGVIVDAQGEEYVRAEARFLPLSAAESLAVDDVLLYRGGEERIFDTLRAQTPQGA